MRLSRQIAYRGLELIEINYMLGVLCTLDQVVISFKRGRWEERERIYRGNYQKCLHSLHFEKRENSALKHDGWAQGIDHKRPLQSILPPESLGFRNSSKSGKKEGNFREKL
jgi:hypothetical protein